MILKLVRTPLNVHFTAFKSIFLSLYAPITSYECHHCGQSITACSMRLLFTFSPGHILRSVCLQFIAYKDNA